MYKLSGLDASFLYNETPRCPQSVASVQVLELPENVAEDDFIEGLKRLYLNRRHLVPYLTRKLQFVPGMGDHPVWVRDRDFDIDRHLYRVDVAAPGGRAELEAAVAEIHAEHYDRAYPLWRTVVLCGLEGGRVALYSGAHHACLDGMAAQAATRILMDTAEVPREVEPACPGFFDEPPHTVGELIAGAVENVVKSQVRQATRTLDVVETNARLWRRGLDPSAGFGAMVTPAPRTRFNRSIGIKRSYAVGELAVVDVKTAGKKLGATLNDVFLAICGGGIRRYLQREGELPEASLIAGCPVSLRMPGDASMSNQVTMMQVSLASSESNAARRVVQIKESSTTAKGVTADLAGSVDCDPVAWGLPIAMQEMAVRAEQTRAADRAETPFNVVVSNVPGPRKTLYSNGARMVTHYPVSIPTHGMGVNITMQSYDGTLFFGITGCAEALPDASVLRDDIVAEFVALTEDLAEPGLSESSTVGSDIPVPRVAISLEEPIAIAAA